MRIFFPILIALHLIPALVATFVFELYPSWIVASLVLGSFIGILASSQRRLRRYSASAISGLAAFASNSLLTSFYLMGRGFNAQFFYHYNLETLRISLKAYPHLVLAGGLYILVCIIVPLLLPRKASFQSLHIPTLLPALGVLAALIFPPVVSGADHIAEQQALELSGEHFITRERREVEALPLDAPPKNLILIYAESLEQLYFDEDLFPDLMPKLSKLSEDAVQFTDVFQVPGTGWTIAGLVASQCGLPFNVKYFDGQEANVALAAIDEPFKDEICLGDILDAYGYETIFMGGAELSFAGKGSFLAANGYDQVLGLKQLHPEMENPDYRHGWGLYDDSLLELASKRIDALQASGEPYMLSMLTVDTHQPKGHIPKDCTPYREDEPMLNAIHCSDRVIGDFIESLLKREDMDDTVIMLFSDHLANNNTIYDRLDAHASRRRLAWMMWGKDLAPKTIAASATHFDATPTALEAMGIPNYRTNNWGSSILGGDKGFWFTQKEEMRKAAKSFTYLDMEGHTARQGVRIDPLNRHIYIGGKQFSASRAGWDLGTSIFMLLLNSDGTVESIVYAEDMEKFKSLAKDFTVIAVSPDKALAPDAVLPNDEGDAENTAENSAAMPLYYYIGTPSKGTAKQGVTTGGISFNGRQMRRALKHKRIR